MTCSTMHMGRTTAVLLTLTLTLAVPLSAQQEPGPTLAAADTADRTPAMIAAGLLGAGLGFFAGAAVGYGMETTLAHPCSEFCGLGGALLGALVGESMGMAFGVHKANGSRGGYLAALGGPVLVVAGSLAAASLLGDDVPGMAVAVVVPVQLLTSIAGERAAVRNRARPPN